MPRSASVLLALLSCASPPILVDLEPSESEIIYGQTPSGVRDQAVAALLVMSGGSAQPFCSGTLIAPRLVLTAGHCIAPQLNATSGKVFFGELLESPLATHGQLIDISATAIHPEYNAANTSNDIGLIALRTRPVGIVPIPHLSPAHRITAADVGAPVRMLGFGLTEAPFLGTGPAAMERRLEFVATIAQVCPGPGFCGGLVGRSFAYDHGDGGPCSGDSGGPALVERDGHEYVAGVNSTIAAPLVAGTAQADCLRASAGVETTVDAFDSFIDEFIRAQDLAFDACAPGNHGCHQQGVCEDTHGAWTCLGCAAGYEGDGVACADIDECTRGLADCAAEASCTNTPGGFTCGACAPGYEGDGSTCTDVDECALDACDPLAGCENHPGGFACGACPSTHVDVNGDGTACLTVQAAAALTDDTLVGSCAATSAPGWIGLLLLLLRRRP